MKINFPNLSAAEFLSKCLELRLRLNSSLTLQTNKRCSCYEQEPNLLATKISHEIHLNRYHLICRVDHLIGSCMVGILVLNALVVKLFNQPILKNLP